MGKKSCASLPTKLRVSHYEKYLLKLRKTIICELIAVKNIYKA